MENENFVLVEDDGKTIIPNKQLTPFEELHCAEYDKFLVPLFIVKGDEHSFLGNGVIVNNYLITATHIVVCNKCRRNHSKIYYRIENEYVEVNDEMLIHDGRDSYGKVVPDENDIHDDLIVYELKEKYNAFKLSEDSVAINDELAILSYSKDSETEEISNSQKSVCKVTALKKGRLKNKTLDWQNCFIVENGWFFRPGNSGSALFDKDTVYGILITVDRGGFGSIGTVIEAKYIMGIINEYEDCIKENNMFRKGNTMFQGKVKHEAEAIKNLLAFVPEKLGKMREEIIASIEAESEEIEERNEESQRYEKSVWFPSYDFSFVDYMLNVFFSSMVLRIYSFAENGLKVLAEINTKPKLPKDHSGQKQPSDIDLYYQKIDKKQGISLPPIETLWPNKDSFHALRKRITHYGQGQLNEQESDSLSTELETIMKMLLFVEEQIRMKNPKFNPE